MNEYDGNTLKHCDCSELLLIPAQTYSMNELLTQIGHIQIPETHNDQLIHWWMAIKLQQTYNILPRNSKLSLEISMNDCVVFWTWVIDNKVFVLWAIIWG